MKPTKNVYLPPTRVQPELRDRLRLLADREQTSVSAIIRRAIIKYMRLNDMPRSHKE